MKEGIFYSKHLESAILGACLMESTGFGRCYGIIDEESFYYEDNRKIFSVMFSMFENNVPIEFITVYVKLIENNISLHAGEAPWYLVELTKAVVQTSNLEFHCHMLKEMWRKRELDKITHAGFDPSESTRKQINTLNKQIQNIIGGEIKKDWYTMDEIMYGLMVHQEEVKSGIKNFITSGIKAIDRKNGGFWAPQMIVLGARPSVGKSAYMGKMAVSMAKQGKKVGIISLEMNNNEIAARLASLETDFDFSTIYRNLFKDEKDHERFYQIISKQTVNLPIYISDKTKVDSSEIKAKAAKLISKYGCDVLMIDYLQLVDSSDDSRNTTREQQVSRISRGIKLMAVEMNIPIIVLCQLNRAVTNRSAKDRYPKLSDLRESGAIEQDADVVMMLHRDWLIDIYENADGTSTEKEADLLGVKWRNGATFSLKLDFDPEKMKFSERTDNAVLGPGNWTPIQEKDLFSDNSNS